MNNNSLRSFLSLFVIAYAISFMGNIFPRTSQAADADTTTKLQTVIAGSHRTEADKARDQYRHPLETLTWFGIKDNMTVVELVPGGGWYTDILAPFLKERGVYYAAGFDPESEVEYMKKGAQRFKEKIDANTEMLGKTHVTILAPPNKT
ncbi:MAG: hypothetical protein AB7P69_13390 [Candidatus Binatia bacterium]